MSRSAPPTPISRRYRSISAFTAAAVVLLERQGLLHFDDPLSKYIPDFPRGGEIRISQLLGHSSGIPDFYSLPEYEEMKTRHVAITDLIVLLKTKPLDFAPGSSSSYSNSGYALLAYIVEKVSGRSYQDFLRERIFAPLHLDHTGFWERQPILPGLATGYEPWLPPAGAALRGGLDHHRGVAHQVADEGVLAGRLARRLIRGSMYWRRTARQV